MFVERDVDLDDSLSGEARKRRSWEEEEVGGGRGGGGGRWSELCRSDMWS